jgi:two-component system NtrC family sensor kinase
MDQEQTQYAALRERVKELTCLYSLAQLAQRPGMALEEILQQGVELLPPAWQYPEVTAGRIALDGRCYATANFKAAGQMQSAAIVVNGQRRGSIDVVYAEPKPELDEGPFLKEERNLIEAMARHIALLVERRQAEEDRFHLQEQLRHADRLATIGQLAAGVAHELNEPLGNILGFAQLAQKQPDLPPQVARDLEKIVATSLYARQIINNLMLLSRQIPPQKTPVGLNAVLEQGLEFLESRCARNGIAVVRQLSPDLPEIIADASQLRQVFVNLVVNAIHAMPGGGTLKVTTARCGDGVLLSVEDDGMGMSEEVLRDIFVPFFTTKDVSEGTGLGLPVVHGIVTSHGGTIQVQSAPGQGARFDVRLPAAADEHTKEDKTDDILC